ncbi:MULTISPECIES: DUF488 domain-containing protein [Virgibacillus]|uniref:DUF488 domain-containing protein n=1 Tax=Virgibacillus halodenitrificans TaxID=1482 RepID=A0AAC9NML2_VIRHA|nr:MULTISPECIES: DUF488 domain-containing protein [Virgibacillus]AIF44722.1 uroporphyrin-III C-methyltransferase [Virgibacillus sp. SK37]APC49809.1 hypothetical protein BME96_17125 [Virgibacillus halodenitrificans]MBD1223443.1 DUF488 domain-containing protein [Virgibacillus halodenitrificans]MCG1029202.1 DUF488 domain-containing protein [Virgibacillus halodenitrificans]MCJ0932812.1 DUF488 domain-containing protein [Virgibacillus halodenitrificans]
MPVQIKRIYNEEDQNDGFRVLVDRVWPRGMSKESANLDEWMKNIGPSNELRKWFNHDPEKFSEFKKKYKDELQNGDQNEELEELKDLTKKHNKHITLLFSAKDENNNQAAVLKEILDRQ